MNQNKSNALAILALIFGIVGLVLSCILIGVLPSIAGLILGIVALSKNQSKGLSIAGIVCSAIGILISIIVFIAAISAHDSEPVNNISTESLDGNWEERDKSGTYHAGYISEDVIELFWVSDDGDSLSLYWSGSYANPEKLEDGYSWESVNNKEKTDNAILASGDDTKTFTYKNGELTYTASALGTTKTVRLIPTDTDYLTAKNGNTEQTAPSIPKESNEEETTHVSEQDLDVEVLSDYTLPDGIGWFTRHFIVVKNNSDCTVDVSTSSLAYDADGTMVSAADGSFYALGAGCVSVLYEAFETNQEIDHYETELNVSKSTYYKSVIQDLTYAQNDIDKGAIFQITNNGEKAAEFVEGYAMFFKGDELVSFESTYFTDDDSEIKPGKTISKQLTSNEEFDKIEFYLTGRR